jgi:LPXTG-site transpeptidase (sortase) family protein
LPGATEGRGRHGGRAAGVLLAALIGSTLLTGCGSGTVPATAGGTAPSAVAVGASGTASGSGLPSPPATTGPRPPARSVPVRLEIPGIGVDTPVIRLGLAADGSVQVPPIAAHAPAGWYQGSPTPGQLGPSVILAHVTVGKYGDGVFLHLSRLKPGDRVVARLADGASATFTVYRVQTVAKAQFPTAAVYGDVDRPELRLITCGGPRNSDGAGYLDNVVVYAALDPAAGGAP